MKSRWIALVLGTSLGLACVPAFARAQVAAPGGGAPAGGGGAAGSGGISAVVGQGLVTSVATISASSGTPSATTIPSNSNYLGSNYVNYFTLGLPQNYQAKFGGQNVTGGAGM